MRVPIVEDMPFFKSLSVEAGYRFSDYNTAANTTNTYKVGVDWAPIQDIKFRAAYNRAVRAPNVTELFTPHAVGLFGGADPCAAGLITGAVAATLEQCQRSGVTAAQYTAGIDQCPAAQCTALLGGNTDLKAEKADTYTAGFILQPRFLPRFNLSVDYFNIKVANLISSLPNLIVVDCVLNGNATSCARFHRDPATGAIFGNAGYVDATNVNTGYLKTEGVDVNANYNMRFEDYGMKDWGGLTFALNGTYTRHYTVQPTTGSATFDCAGLYGPVCSALTNASSGPIPKWRHQFRVTWSTPWRVELSGAWRYLSKVKFDGNEANIYLADPLGRTDIPDAKIKSYSYFDLSALWKVRDAVTFRAGVSNIFDKDPPILDSNAFPASGPPYGNGNSYPGTYDSMGRTLFAGLTFDF
jgi:outer membrane receptor protein involved in Fe transport